jgi:hypothetical protein
LHACVTVFEKQGASIVALPLALGVLDPEECVKPQLEHTRACMKRFFRKIEGGCTEYGGGLAGQRAGRGFSARQEGEQEIELCLLELYQRAI